MPFDFGALFCCSAHMALHTPYDGSSKLFTVGLQRLDLHDWIETDGDLRRYLDEKDRLANSAPEAIFAAEPGSEASQAEVLHLLADHLPARYPDIYQRLGPHIEIVPAFRPVRLDDPYPPLRIAEGLVQEDLLLMRKGPQGWYLGAGHLCFPSVWRLREKFMQPMQAIHAPVPGFSDGTRNNALIERMFDNLRPEMPVIRWNWSLHADDALHLPHGPAEWRFGGENHIEHLWFRVERQTLRKLPLSGDILFTVRIYIDPLAALEAHPDAAGIAANLAAQLAELTPEQLAYKGIAGERERLIARLREIANP